MTADRLGVPEEVRRKELGNKREICSGSDAYWWQRRCLSRGEYMDSVAIRVFSFSISPMVIAASHLGLVSVPHAPYRLGCERRLRSPDGWE
jgi:hypothetical protein